MLNLNGSSNFVRRSLVLTAIFGASFVGMSAQNASATGQKLDLSFVSDNPLAYSSSVSTSVDQDTEQTTAVASVASDPLHLNAMQYNGRPRYQRPRYRGENTNPDGSNKWMAYGGFGFAQPAGNTWKYFTPNWGLQVGGGRQLNAHFAVPVEFDYDTFGMTKQAISNQSYIYTEGTDSNAADNGIDANMHTWSFSIDPRYTFVDSKAEGFGAYILADVGFYHKVTNFTAPQDEEYCDPYYGCEEVAAQGNFDHYTSNAPGFGVGVGATYKFSHFSNQKFYAEARYIFMDNSQRYGYTAANLTTTSYDGSNAFPANSNRTTYIPVKFGIQF